MLRLVNYYRFYVVFNNIKNLHFVISDYSGNILFKKSCGSLDKSSKVKQTTVFSLLEFVNNFCIKNKIQHVFVFFLGSSFQKISFMKDLFYQSFTVHKVYYVSNRVFNGCRKKKQRRLLFLGKCLSGLKYQF